MKFFPLAASFIFITNQQQIDCGQTRLPSSDSICIQPEYIEGCLIYQTQTCCLKCDAEYQINLKGTCDALQFVQRENKIEGCLRRYSEDLKKCVNCANGYILRKEKCEKGVRNCQQYNQNNTCKVCRQNYSLAFNVCHQNPILGCRKLHKTHTCLQCQFPFQINNQHHNCSIPNCKDYNDYGCVTCECGFYLDRNRACLKIQEGCLRYQRGNCINCLKHYRLKGNSCQIEGCAIYKQGKCLECEAQYEKDEGGCVYKNCSDWSNNQCLSCKQGYKNQRGICVKEKLQYCQP